MVVYYPRGPDDNTPPTKAPEDSSVNYRKIFETSLHSLPREARILNARSATGNILSAYCYDPDPQTISSVLKNMHSGLEQARLIAHHHRTPQGLNELAKQLPFLRDNQVRHYLLRNPQTSEILLNKLIGKMPLSQVYRLNLSREYTDRTRRSTRQIFRDKFRKASADERVNLLFNTEARCLSILAGFTFDTKMTALLCRRSYHSTLMVQNLARFPATPPNVIRHLLNQPVAKRAAHLRKQLLRHPNCPSHLKV